MDYSAIGKHIRAERKRLGLSQEELAEMVNISAVHMSHIETGYTKLSLPVLVDLACALGVRTDDLIFDKDTLGKDELLEEITLEPVSYTHLDVYKRQGKSRPQGAIAFPTSPPQPPAGRSVPCLLYTSRCV